MISSSIITSLISKDPVTLPAFTNTRTYTGIGSRKVPPDIYDLFIQIAEVLSLKGWKFRSGGARGSDYAFQTGAEQGLRRGGVGGEVYLPKSGFNYQYPNGLTDPSSDIVIVDAHDIPLYHEAEAMARAIHPIGPRLRPDHLEMHARNMFQPLGVTLDAPSEAILLWAPPTKDGVSGGTATAHKLAQLLGIPIHNFFYEEVANRAIDRILNAA